MINTTIDYYNINAKKFVNDTINVEFIGIQNKFISKLLAYDWWHSSKSSP